MKKVKKVLLAINILVVLGTFLAFLSPRIHPDSSSLPGLMGLLYPVLLIANCVFILFWLSVRKWYMVASLAILILGYRQVGAFIQLTPSTDIAADTGGALSVATYNVFGFRKLESRHQPGEALKAVTTQLGNPDILCLQEAPNADALGKQIGLPYVFHIPNCQSNILSKFPMIGNGGIKLTSGPSLSGFADFDVHGDTVRLYLLHLKSNRITQRTEDLMEQGRLQDSDTWIEIGQLLGKYSEAATVRAAQADELRSHITSSPHPVIVCGDFNDVPQSYTYTKIKGDMQDSFIKKGSGVGTTYGGKVPGLRIDYILADANFTFASHRVLRIDSSDHYPVVATIRIKDL